MGTKYYFDVELSGIGDTLEEAWSNCIDNLDLDPGCVPSVLATEEQRG